MSRVKHISINASHLFFSYGVTAFDTSAYYQESEIVLGTALKALELDFPRSTYKLVLLFICER